MFNPINIRNRFNKRHIENIFLFLCIFLGLSIFSYYIYRIIIPECSHLGYTLCAAIGQDFFSLYQAGHNIISSNFIYGPSAGDDLVVPYFMQFKYLPITAIIWGVLFRFIFPNAQLAYYSYLTFSIMSNLEGAIFIWLIWKKKKVSKYTLGLALLFWFGFFALNSEWRMGQFNNIAGVFFLGFITSVVYQKKYLSPVLWTLSLSWKPLALFATPFFLKIKKNFGIIFFIIFIFGSTIFYILYFQIQDTTSLIKFFDTLLLEGDRFGWQIHYIDNFSINTFIGEIFYDNSPNIFNIVSKSFSFSIIFLLAIFSIALKLKTVENKVLYLLFAVSTFMVFHKEIWESLLTFWAPILVVSLLFAKEKWEKVLIGVCGFFLATPSLYYFWNSSRTELWRFFLFAEKAIPQAVLYFYLLYKMYINLRKSLKVPGLLN